MKIYALLLVCIIFIIQGCTEAIVISTAAIATKASKDPRSIGTQIDDSTLKARIISKLIKDQQLRKDARIISTVYQNKVLLIGQAPKYELIERAKNIILSIDDTIDIYNEIRLNKIISLKQLYIDFYITTKLRILLLKNNAIKSSNIKITTENGEVFLLGLVNRNEGKIVATIASKINNVKHVIVIFTYVQ